MNLKQILLICLLLVTLSVAKKKTFHGHSCTGLNAYKGQPLFNFTKHPQWPYSTGFGAQFRDQVGIYNATPGAANAIPLNPTTPNSVLLATFVQNSFFPFPSSIVPDLVRLNIPMKDVPVNTDRGFIRNISTTCCGNVFAGAVVNASLRNQALEVSEALNLSDPFIDLNTDTDGDILLGDWLQPEGKLKVNCKNFPNEPATFNLKVSGLVPNAMYQICFLFEVKPPTGVGAPLGAVNAGGTPGVFVTDEKGNYETTRTINFCPLDDVIYNLGTGNEKRVFAFTVIYKSDRMNYGHIPVASHFGAQLLHDQIIFPLVDAVKLV